MSLMTFQPELKLWSVILVGDQYLGSRCKARPRSILCLYGMGYLRYIMLIKESTYIYNSMLRNYCDERL